jgi:hypothetical protein
MAIAQGQIGTTATTIYTSTNDSATTVIFFCNTTGSDATVSAYAVPSGGTAGATNQIIKDLTIPGGDTYIMNAEKLVLSNADTIQAESDTASAITATVSYVGI